MDDTWILSHFNVWVGKLRNENVYANQTPELHAFFDIVSQSISSSDALRDGALRCSRRES